jgi:hypothetical protein
VAVAARVSWDALPLLAVLAFTFVVQVGRFLKRGGAWVGGLAVPVSVLLIAALATVPDVAFAPRLKVWRWVIALAVAGLVALAQEVPLRARRSTWVLWALWGPVACVGLLACAALIAQRGWLDFDVLLPVPLVAWLLGWGTVWLPQAVARQPPRSGAVLAALCVVAFLVLAVPATVLVGGSLQPERHPEKQQYSVKLSANGPFQATIPFLMTWEGSVTKLAHSLSIEGNATMAWAGSNLTIHGTGPVTIHAEHDQVGLDLPMGLSSTMVATDTDLDIDMEVVAGFDSCGGSFHASAHILPPGGILSDDLEMEHGIARYAVSCA